MDEFKSTKVLPGDVVFELYDTFGFPVDLTALMAGEQGVEVDEAGFEAAMEATKARSRAAGKLSTDDWVQVHDDSETTFVGYDAREAECRILRYREVKAKNKQFYRSSSTPRPSTPKAVDKSVTPAPSPHPVAALRFRHQERKQPHRSFRERTAG